MTSKYQLAQGVPQEASGSSEGSGSKGLDKKDSYQALDWAKGSSDSDFVKALRIFKDLLADKDKCSKTFYLKARVAVSLQSLAEVLPTYTDKDFVVVERKSDKGVWRSEVWTKRAFEPLEIQLGPWSSQLKDTHLMASAHVVVGLPKHGRGAHPENSSLAFDGRGRNLMAPSELLSTEEHKGSLFWIVQRTSKASDANLVFENVTFETQVTVSLPALKKPHD